MNLNLKATGIELSQAVREYAEKKFGSLDKLLPEPRDSHIVRAEIGKTTEHHREGLVFRAEVHISGGGLDLYATAEAEDIYAAIDLVEAEASRELRSKKGRTLRLARRGGRMFKDMIRGISSKFRRRQ